jgi:hypothetical protein
MRQQPYPYTHKTAFRYEFVSTGKTAIPKLVIFAPTPVKNVFNIAFGDLLDNDSIDDTVRSNNGDLIKVLVTIIQILKEFTKEYPYAKVIFSGSTPIGTALYRRIIKTYYIDFTNEFIISALVETKTGYSEVPFDPSSSSHYLAFLIKRF